MRGLLMLVFDSANAVMKSKAKLALASFVNTNQLDVRRDG